MDNDKENERPFLKERASIEFLNKWNKLYKEKFDDDIPQLIENIKTFEKIHSDHQRALILFSFKDFKVLHWSGGFEELFGYTLEEINLWNIRLYFQSIIWEHIHFPIKAFQWGNKLAKSVPIEKQKEASFDYFCGLKIKNKSGEVLKIFVSQTILSFKNNKPAISLVMVEDVQYLMKESFFWGRYARGKNNKITKFFRSKGPKSEYTDIITPREKEILNLIAKGCDTKAIAKILNISPNTVETHRKNMLARSGAKNTTALIQLCRLCNAI